MLPLSQLTLLAFSGVSVLGNGIVPRVALNETETQYKNSSATVRSSIEHTHSSSIVFTSSSIPTQSRTSSTGLGGYVALGLGLNDASSESSSQTSSASLTTTSTITVTIETSLAPTGQASRASNGNVTQSSGVNPLTNSTQPIYSAISTNSTHLHNLTYVGACWDQWTEYWSYSAANIGAFMTEIVSTETTLYPVQETTLEYGTYTLTDTWTYYSTALEGAFPMSTYSSTTTETDTLTWSPGITFTVTNTVGSASGETVVTTSGFAQSGGPITTPSCVLPSIVPQCQSMWNAWVNDSFPGVLPYTCSNTMSGPCSSEKSSFGAQFSSYVDAAPVLSYAELLGPTPLCSQASVSADGCSSLVKYLLTNSDSGARQTFASFPAGSVLAPGCTVGCQTCAITGNSVQLYYWPPTTATVANQSYAAQPTITSAPRLATTVSEHDGTYFTFTSPTIYVSYKMLYASDSCSGIGPTFRNTIVPLTGDNQLSSLMVYLGDADYPDTVYKTVPFNLTDLAQTPVPASIYNKDPKCASSSDYTMYWDHVFSPDWTTDRVSFSCRSTAPYAPIIAVPDRVSNLDPAWKRFTAWYGGLYDPPKALTPATAEALPTLTPGDQSQTAASPSSQAQSPAKATSALDPSVASPTAEPELQASTSPNSTNQASGTHASPSTTKQSPTTQGQEASSFTAETSADPGGIIVSVLEEGSTAAASATGDSQAATDIPAQSSQQGSADTQNPAATTLGQAQTQVVTAAGSDITVVQSQDPSASSVAIVNGQTLLHGQVASVGDGTVSAGTAGVVVNGGDGQTTVAPQTTNSAIDTQAQVITAGGSTMTVVRESGASGGSVAIVDGETLSNGEEMTVGGQTLSVGPDGVIAGGSNDLAVASPTPAPKLSDPANSIVTVGSSAYTAVPSSGQVVVAQGGSTATLEAGSGTVLNGQTINLGSSGGVVIGSTTVNPIDQSSPSPTAFEATVTGNDGQLLTFKQQGSSYVIAEDSSTYTVAAGSQTTINGQTIGVPASMGAVVVDGSTRIMPVGTADARAFSFDGHVLSASAVPGQPGVEDINGVTLTSGGPAQTVDGVKISISQNGIVMAADGSMTTVPLGSNTASSILSFDGRTLSASAVPGQPGIEVIDGVTLTSGGSAKTVDGVAISIGQDGLVMAAGGSTTTMPLDSSTASGTSPVDSTSTTGASMTSSPDSPTSTSSSNSSSSGTRVAICGPMTFVLLFVLAIQIVR